MKREFLTTNEVAQKLGLSPFTIRRYIGLRKLKAVKLMGGYRVRAADLNRFLKAREIETEEELAEMGKSDDGKKTRGAREKSREPRRASRQTRK